MCVYSTMTSVRSGNTLLNQPTVKLLSPLRDNAVDKQLALAQTPVSRAETSLFTEEAYLLTFCISSCSLKGSPVPTAEWENRAPVTTARLNAVAQGVCA